MDKPGEACGPRVWLSPQYAHDPDGSSIYLTEEEREGMDLEPMVPLAELLQGMAAHELELADIQRDGERMIAQICTAMRKAVVERDAERAALASS